MIGSLSNLRGPDLLIVLLIVVLLFGATKLPALARGIREALEAFKEGKGKSDAGESAASERSRDHTKQNIP
jgi:sec-independent protein translocase protein TatA